MELLFNIFIGLVLIVFFVESTTFDGMTVSTDKIGANGFPQMIIIISFMLLLYITYNYIKNKGKAKKDVFNIKDKGFRIMLINIVLLAIYIFTMNYIGFILGTFIFIIVAAWSMGYREKVKSLIFSLVLTMSITLVFGKVFYVALPRGLGLLREISYFIY